MCPVSKAIRFAWTENKTYKSCGKYKKKTDWYQVSLNQFQVSLFWQAFHICACAALQDVIFTCLAAGLACFVTCLTSEARANWLHTFKDCCSSFKFMHLRSFQALHLSDSTDSTKNMRKTFHPIQLSQLSHSAFPPFACNAWASNALSTNISKSYELWYFVISRLEQQVKAPHCREVLGTSIWKRSLKCFKYSMCICNCDSILLLIGWQYSMLCLRQESKVHAEDQDGRICARTLQTFKDVQRFPRCIPLLQFSKWRIKKDEQNWTNVKPVKSTVWE